MLRGLRKNVVARHRAQLHMATIALVVVAFVVFGGGALLLAAQVTGSLKLTGSYATTQVVAGAYSNTIECAGSIQPYRVTSVATSTPGTVTSVYVREGDYIRQGTVLFDVQDGSGVTQSVTASVSGTVRGLNVEPGMASDAFATDLPALQIADMNVLVGVVQVPEYVSMLVRSGQYVSVSSPVTPGVDYEGMITGFSKEATPTLTDAGQAQYDATIMFDDLGTLQVGDSIVAEVRIDDYGEVYYVPACAVEEIDGVAYVDIVRADATVRRHQVELLGTDDSGNKIVYGDVLTSETVIRADTSE